MLDLDAYLQKLIGACQAAFRDRLLYAGLQGSYLRGEATDQSDIDVMIHAERPEDDFDAVFRQLFGWCQNAFLRADSIR